MIDRAAAGRVSLSREDFESVANAVMDRFSLRAAEGRRLAMVRELLATAAELNRTLATHTHRSLVHCQGSHGVGDIAADTVALFEALDAFATRLRDTADAYRTMASFRDDQMRLDSAGDPNLEFHGAISAR